MPSARSTKTIRDEIQEHTLRRSIRIQEAKLRDKSKEVKFLKRKVRVSSEINETLEHRLSQVQESLETASRVAFIAKDKLSYVDKREGLGVYGDFLAQEVAEFRPHFELVFKDESGNRPRSTATDMVAEMRRENGEKSRIPDVDQFNNRVSSSDPSLNDRVSSFNQSSNEVRSTSNSPPQPLAVDNIEACAISHFQRAVNLYLRQRLGDTVYDTTSDVEKENLSRTIRIVILLYDQRNEFSHNSVLGLPNDEKLPAILQLKAAVKSRDGFSNVELNAIEDCIERYLMKHSVRTATGEYVLHEEVSEEVKKQRQLKRKRANVIAKEMYRKSFNAKTRRSVPPVSFPTGDLQRGDLWGEEIKEKNGTGTSSGGERELTANKDEQGWVEMEGFDL